MKILFISNATAPDYLADSIFHGLRSLYGADCVDVNKLSYMYKGAEKSSLYGKGFTLYGTLDDIPVDRTDIRAKLRAGYFDRVIFGCVYRDNLREWEEFFDGAIFLDGADARQQANHYYYLQDHLVGRGPYFKREMIEDKAGVFPITFSIPKEKIRDRVEKTTAFAPLVPGLNHQHTYIYNDEDSYYDAYATSYFAFTCKKGGWDCMRHYEIMAAGAIPYFLDIELCPQNTLWFLPKLSMQFYKHGYSVIPNLVDGYASKHDKYYVGNSPREDGWIDGVAGDFICPNNLGSLSKNFSESCYDMQWNLLRYWLNSFLTTERMAQYLWKCID